MNFNFKSLADFMEFFRDEKSCVEYFSNVRFGSGCQCPHCHHSKIYRFKNGIRYRCSGCKEDFSIRTGTIFEGSKLPLKKWFIAIYLLTNCGKGISSIQLSKHLGVTQKTAWFMAHRIRQAAKQPSAKLKGVVEADETYIGGKAKNMHAKRRRAIFKGRDRGTSNKIPVFGVKDRKGSIRSCVIREVDMPCIHRAVLSNVEKGSTLYTDEHRAYNLLGRSYRRGIVRHGLGEYVNGNCHTNGIESFWSLFKRGYHGTYHWMSKKHLPRYVDEFTFRFNERGRTMPDLFGTTIKRVAATRKLSYLKLTKQT